MTFYSDKAALASKLLAKYGQDVVFDYETGGAYDPVAMTTSGAGTGSETLKAFPTNFSKFEVSDTILTSDIKLIVEVPSSEFGRSVTCSINGYPYRVISFDTIGLIGDYVIFYFQLRR